MSYDLQVFSCYEPSADLSRLAEEEELERGEGYFRLSGNAWQVVFHSADEVETEDIPPAVFRELPGIRYMILVTIEGEASTSLISRACRLAKKLAKVLRGILVDPQKDTVETARGIKRIDLAAAPKEADELTLSWWFEDADSFERDGYARFFDVLDTHAPEALPRRYGLWEPPQFKFAELGREHFRSFLHDHLRDLVVWYPSRPFADVFISIPPKVGASRQGYRCCRIEMSVDIRVLNAPGWPLGLKRLWLAVAQIVSPFFAEIREGKSPVTSWWWSGIPSQLGFATIIGSPYRELWPEFISQGIQVSPQLSVIEVLETRQSPTLTPPIDIMQPEQPALPSGGVTGPELMAFLNTAKRRYPKTWPFSAPFE